MWSYNYTYQNYLAHYGVLGMKWGVRKYRNEDGTLTEAGKKRYDYGIKNGNPDDYSSDRTLSRSISLQNISDNGAREIRDSYSPLYASHTKSDNNFYKSMMPFYKDGPVTVNKLMAKHDLKVAGTKVASEEFVKYANSNRKAIARYMAANREMKVSDLFGLSPINDLKAYHKYKNADDDFLRTQGYREFNLSLGYNDQDKRNKKTQAGYLKVLSDKGYDAINDLCDLGASTGKLFGAETDGAQDPLIILNGKKTVDNIQNYLLEDK